MTSLAAMRPRPSKAPPRPRWRALGWLAASGAASLCLALLVALALIQSGVFPVGASRPHDRLSYWATRTTMVHSVRRAAAQVTAPPPFTPQEARAGFRIYDANCVMCHGAPGLPQAPIAAELMPAPPYLLNAAQDWTPSELYWIVRNGVKMTAMPAWDRRLDRRQTWELVAFLEVLPRLNYRDYLRWRGDVAPAGAPPATVSDAARG